MTFTSTSFKLTSVKFAVAYFCLSSLLSSAPFDAASSSDSCSASCSSRFFADAGPTSHIPASAEVASSMSSFILKTNDLTDPKKSIQLQMEAIVGDKQILARLPITGPTMDFYYINYLPSYQAGVSSIDFWMMTPDGMTPPSTAGLDLYDEFGKTKILTLFPSTTPVPKEHVPGKAFLWKSWSIPKKLDSKFDFSEKFRIVLTTSDSVAVPTTAVNKGKRGLPVAKPVKEAAKAGRNNNNKDPKVTKQSAEDDKKKKETEKKNNNNVESNINVRDRHFVIRGLVASPGGQPNPTVQAISGSSKGLPVNAAARKTKTDSNEDSSAISEEQVNSNSAGSNAVVERATAVLTVVAVGAMVVGVL